MAVPAVRTLDLTRHFGPVRAVEGLTLEVPHGAIFGFLGPNGAGKTTTIRLLLGLLDPTRGSAEVLGFDTRTHSHEIRSRTGALLEHSGLYERLTAWDNLEFHARIWRMSPPSRAARITEVLTHFGLWERRHERVGAWSRGIKQKLAVARAVLHRPSVVFLDEPTAGLDPVAAAALREDLAALAASGGVTVFLTTHNLAEAEKLCTLVGVLKGGRLLALDTPAGLRATREALRVEVVGRLFSEPLLARLRAHPAVHSLQRDGNRLSLVLREGADVAPLVTLMVESGAQVEEVRRVQASLEEVFLSLVEEN